MKVEIPKFQFTENMDAVVWKDSNGVINYWPWKTLTEEEKRFILEQKAMEGY